ncbi:restriction endonuclease subunit S [Psychrobacter alimentarius]|uniref:restriction endonuclease subunit S n=1 Tax=Psychrobacter TaxID=497 RepID=UPI000BAAF576|nr:restriction endonuclease subunit S [Psychrobacter sp. JB193]PAT62545.1 hypothetical protein CIK80_08105 [Psychrobacter sp. JB193]
MVPNGWEKTDLTHLINIKHGFAFKSEYFRETGDHILLTPGSFYEKGGFKDQKDKTKYYIGEIPDSYLLSKNDLLIAMTEQASGLLGSALFVPEQNIYLHNQRLGKIEIKAKERIDLNFLYLMFNSPLARKQISEQSTGTKVKHTSPDKLKSIICLLPPFPEQQKIAKILSTWDNAIGATERLIENSTQQKKALMQQLLTGKKRLLDESGKRFESEWEERAVSSLGKIYSGGTPSTSNTGYWDGDINWITPTDITKQDSRYINSSLRKITLEGLENSSAKLVPAGSLLICTRATIGAMAITSHEMCTNQGFKNIVPNSKTNIEFVYYLLTYNKHRMISKASGSTFLELSKTSFESMKFNIPAIKEQQKIATVLTNTDKEIELLKQQLADLQQEKKALMQVLLTGKKRVVVDG